MHMLRELNLLGAGHCLIDQSQLLTGDPSGTLLRIPIWMYLLRTDDALFLVDTGMPPRCIDNENVFGALREGDRILPQMTADDMVDAVLRRRGLRPQDIDSLISTHWHFDHAGGNSLFRNQPILVHSGELDAASRGAYPPECRDMTLDYRLVEDGDEPVPGVTLLHTPGHTPGHLSLLVRVEGLKPILLTIDASYTRRNWDLDIPGAMMDPETGRRSVSRLREIAQATDAAVFFGHDAAQAQEPFWLTLAR